MGWIAEHGMPFESEPLTHDEMRWLFETLDAEGSRYPIKQCFSNSQLVLLHADVWGDSRHELVYAEGYAQSVIPVHHGWLLLNGKVIDLTMRLSGPLKRTSPVKKARLRNRVLGEFPETQSGFPIFEPDSPDCPIRLGGKV